MTFIQIIYLVLVILFIAVAAFFSVSETALVSLQRVRLQNMINSRVKNAALIAKLTEKPEKLLSAVLMGNELFQTAAAALATALAISFWGENTGVAIATIIMSVVLLIFVDTTPKTMGVHSAEKLSLAFARPISIISWLLTPFVFVLSWISLGLTKLVGGTPVRRSLVSEEEIRTMISMGHKEGVVESGTAEMLHNVFDFNDRTAAEVMVPRMDVVFVEKGSKLSEFLAVYAKNPLSRFPVYFERRDNVVGTVSTKDVLMALAKGSINNDSPIDEVLRPAYFTVESKPISQLFAEMRDNNYHMAIVVDEFGGTSGVVSLSQLIEEIVGPVGDEMGGVEKEYEKINESTFEVDAGMRIEEANEKLGLGLPEGDYDTVAGFILNRLQHIPKQGEQLKYKDLKMVVTRMLGAKIEEVLVSKEKPLGTILFEPKGKNAASKD